jgi:hypothetical protein
MHLDVFRIEFDLSANDLPKLLGRLHGLEAAVEVDGRLYIPMPEETPHSFIVSGMMLQIERRAGMPELVGSDP